MSSNIRQMVARLVGVLSSGPPQATISPRLCGRHGTSWTDNYAWMQDRARESELARYLEAETRYADHVMAPLTSSVKDFKSEIQHFAARATGNSIQYGQYNYFLDVTAQVDCRELNGRAERLFSRQQLAERFGPDASLLSIKIHPEHRMAIYLLSTEGDIHAASIVCFDTGTILDTVSNVWNAEWTKEPGVLLYTRLDSLIRPAVVFRHTIGRPQCKDKALYEEPHDRFFVDITRTKDGEFLMINSNSKTSSEVRILPATDTARYARMIHPRDEFMYFVEHWGSEFFMATDADNSHNFKIVRCPDKAFSKNNWVDFVPHKPNQKLVDFEVFENHCIVYRRSVDGLPGLECHPFKADEAPWTVNLPNPICTLHPLPTPVLNSQVSFATSTPLQSRIEWEYNPAWDTLNQVIDAEPPSSLLNIDDFTCRRSADGTKIPITLIHSQDLQLDGQNPLVLRAYGSYGESLEADYLCEHMPLLRRGFVVAYCHIRGGSELGAEWYEQVRSKNKFRTVQDLLACVELLHSKGYSSPSKTAGIGASAGGLVFGAACNQAPHLFRALVLKVPFVDVLQTMLDENLPLTAHEQDEWGDPINDLDAFKQITGYCPYTNVSEHDYPALYMTTSLQDDRVPPWQPAKYAAKLRATSTGDNPIILSTDQRGGHFGNHATIEEDLAKECAFLAWQLGAQEVVYHSEELEF